MRTSLWDTVPPANASSAERRRRHCSHAGPVPHPPAAREWFRQHKASPGREPTMRASGEPSTAWAVRFTAWIRRSSSRRKANMGRASNTVRARGSS